MSTRQWLLRVLGDGVQEKKLDAGVDGAHRQRDLLGNNLRSSWKDQLSMKVVGVESTVTNQDIMLKDQKRRDDKTQDELADRFQEASVIGVCRPLCCSSFLWDTEMDLGCVDTDRLRGCAKHLR